MFVLIHPQFFFLELLSTGGYLQSVSVWLPPLLLVGEISNMVLSIYSICLLSTVVFLTKAQCQFLFSTLERILPLTTFEGQLNMTLHCLAPLHRGPPALPQPHQAYTPPALSASGSPPRPPPLPSPLSYIPTSFMKGSSRRAESKNIRLRLVRSQPWPRDMHGFEPISDVDNGVTGPSETL